MPLLSKPEREGKEKHIQKKEKKNLKQSLPFSTCSLSCKQFMSKSQVKRLSLHFLASHYPVPTNFFQHYKRSQAAYESCFSTYREIKLALVTRFPEKMQITDNPKKAAKIYNLKISSKYHLNGKSICIEQYQHKLRRKGKDHPNCFQEHFKGNFP